MIGGLTEESRISNHSKLPLLGDLPVLGSLFSVEHTNQATRDLYIVVTPHIVFGHDRFGAPAPNGAQASHEAPL